MRPPRYRPIDQPVTSGEPIARPQMFAAFRAFVQANIPIPLELRGHDFIVERGQRSYFGVAMQRIMKQFSRSIEIASIE